MPTVAQIGKALLGPAPGASVFEAVRRSVRSTINAPFNYAVGGLGRGALWTGRGASRVLLGDLRYPWTSTQFWPKHRGLGAEASARFYLQTGVGLAAGAYVSMRTVMGETEGVPTGYAPYPGTVAPPPMTAADNMLRGGADNLGADGDLVFALNENYGAGKYL